jgi:hypothetical protein
MIIISYLPAGAPAHSNRVSGAGGVSDKPSDNGSSQPWTQRDLRKHRYPFHHQ